MKKLFIVRHAKSDWHNELEDFDRPLNNRGETDAPIMAQKINNMGLYITGSVVDVFEEEHENYYARIDHYFIDKATGNLQIRVGNYIDKTAASKAFPIYQEDYGDSDTYGYFPAPVSTGSYSWGLGNDLIYSLTP